jgi:hypothetical protein
MRLRKTSFGWHHHTGEKSAAAAQKNKNAPDKASDGINGGLTGVY